MPGLGTISISLPVPTAAAPTPNAQQQQLEPEEEPKEQQQQPADGLVQGPQQATNGPAAASLSSLPLDRQQSESLARQLCAKGTVGRMTEVNWSGHALSVTGLHCLMELWAKHPGNLKKLRLSACGLTDTSAGEQVGHYLQ